MKNPIKKKDKKKEENGVLRGGGWFISAGSGRVSGRYVDVPSLRYGDNGFRIVRTKKNEKSD